MEMSGGDGRKDLICAVCDPRHLSDILSGISFKRGQIATCSADPTEGLQFVADMSSCHAKVHLHAELFESFVVRPDVKFKINLTSLLDCLNVFSQSAATQISSPLHISYSDGEPLTLKLHGADRETSCTVQTMIADENDDMTPDDISANCKALISSEALRDIFAEFDYSNPSAKVAMTSETPEALTFTIDSTSGFTFEASLPKDAAVFTDYECSESQSNTYNLSQLKYCSKALTLSDTTKVSMNTSNMLTLQCVVPNNGMDGAYLEFMFFPTVEEA